MISDWRQMYGRMNESVLRANAAADERRRAGWEREDRQANREDEMARSGLEDAALARDMAQRQFERGGQQFDTRMNVLREMLTRRAPDFYGGGAPARSGLVDRRSGMAGYGGPGSTPVAPQRSGGFAFGMDGGDDMGLGPDIRNYLLRYLRG
jgi:hypothetical protein